MWKNERAGRARRQHWTDGLGSLAEEFERRTGLNWNTDKRVLRAAHPHFHETPGRARRRGRPSADVFNACVVATTNLVAKLQRTGRHDWCAVTIAMIGVGGWGPRGSHTPDRESLRRDVDQLRERIKEAYRRTTLRRGAAGIEPLSRRIKPLRA